MIKYTPKTGVKVGGKMSEEGADRAGNKLANAAMILAITLGSASIISALALLLK